MANSNQILTERDLENIFSGKNKKTKRSNVKRYFINVFIFLALIVITFSILNFGSLKEKIVFWYKTDYQNIPIEKNSATQNENTKQAIIVKPQMDAIENNYLILPAISIKAPIIWNIPNTASTVKAGLVNGLIHIDGTALPGEVGNVFITGHSSNYPWVRGTYNNIFALLDKVVVGDKVQLKYQDKDYLYVVESIKVVEPTDVSVMKATPNSILTLMTCTPIGTSLRRLIVISKQIYPDPSGNIKRNNKNNTDFGEIPKAR